MSLYDCVHIDPEELRLAPYKTNNPDDPDSGNGLITSIWGPPTWEAFHSISFGYPIRPTEEQKQDYLDFYKLFGKVLPCVHCRRSYLEFIVTGDTILDINAMESRETLTKWAMRLHNAVNNKLGIDYGDTYEELCYKYESYRAHCSGKKKEKGCFMPLDQKAKSYQKADMQRAPIIDVKYAHALSKHAKSLGLKRYDDAVAYYSNLTRNSKEWNERDCFARKIIRYMRKHGISPVDDDNMPVKIEMMLICMLSTTLPKEKMDMYLKS
jgi:hypothetical protein